MCAPGAAITTYDLIPSLLSASDVLGTGWFAADTASVKLCATVAVVGDGAVGLLGVLSARQLGAERIIAMAGTSRGRSSPASPPRTWSSGPRRVARHMHRKETTMQQRTLGNNLEVSAIGLGCMSMTGGYSRSPDKQEMIALIRSMAEREVARSLGVNPGQVGIAWLLHKGPDIVPIPGMKRRPRSPPGT